MNWDRARGERIVSERGSDSVSSELDASGRPRRSHGTDRKKEAAAAALKAAARSRERELDKLYWDVMRLPAEQRINGAEWIRRRVQDLTSPENFEKVWNPRFAKATKLAARQSCAPAARPTNLAPGNAKGTPSLAAERAPTDSRPAAAPQPASSALIRELVAAHPRKLTALAVARVLAGVEEDAVPAALRASRWWGACRPRTKTALAGDISELLRSGDLKPAPRRTLAL